MPLLIDGFELTWKGVGLVAPVSWSITICAAVGWLAVLLAYSPLADRIASRLVTKPPTLDVFKSIQQSKSKMIAGIIVAWILGGFIEETILRGVILHTVERILTGCTSAWVAAVSGVCVAAAVAGVVHLYQGLRGTIIIAQLSVLFGVLYVATGHDLWAAILCHGFYDTIAFVRFAMKKSKYSVPGGERTGSR